MCSLLVVNVFYAGPRVLGTFAPLKFMRAADPPPSVLWPSVTACRILPECRCIGSYGRLTFWHRNYFFSFSTPVYKMRIIQEPNTIEL